MQDAVNLAVSGKFHVFNYAPLLFRAGVLHRLYCSHRASTVAQFGLDTAKTKNYPLKEYLVQAHGRIAPGVLYDASMPLYTSIWCRSVVHGWSPAKVLHLLSQGGCDKAISRARRDGAVVIFEAVNTHPQNRLDVLNAEAGHWGLEANRQQLHTRERLMVEEAAAADLVLCPSQAVVDSYVAHGFAASRLHKIPYAANTARFSAKSLPATARDSSRPLSVISVGAIGLRKGQLHLLQALDQLGWQGLELTLVGPMDKSIQPIIDRFRGKFRHFDRVPSSEMPGLMREHDVYVAASLEEGLAVSICEAMASGLAVIATRESGGAELIDDGRNGFLVSARAPEELAERLQWFRSHPDQMEAMGQAAADGMGAKHNWQAYASSLQELYGRFLKA